MSDAFSIGSTGVSAYQRALGTVSNNIANVSTDGYSRQEASLVTNTAMRDGINYLGTGARFDSVKRQYDAFIESNLRHSQSDLQTQDPILTYANRLIDIMGDESIGLTSALNTFFESARNLSSDPVSAVQRGLFLRDAADVASRFQQLSTQTKLLDGETEYALETNVNELNALTHQIAYVNSQLMRVTLADRQPPELMDQRDLLLRKLSELTKFNASFAPNGEVKVSLGDTIDQGVLVDGKEAKVLSQVPALGEEGKFDFIIDRFGANEVIPTMGPGSIGGTITFRDQVLRPAFDALDFLAQAFADEVNAIHQNGLDLEGRVGEPVYTYDADKGAARSIQMIISDASRIAAAGQFRVISNELNPSSTAATIGYQEPSFEGAGNIADTYRNSQFTFNPEVVSVNASEPLKSVAVIPVGQVDSVVFIDGNTSPTGDQSLLGLGIQVFTRDGVRVAGTQPAPAFDSSFMAPSQGYEVGASYLGSTFGDSYMDMDVFIGAKAEPIALQRFDNQSGAVITPVMAPPILRADFASAIRGPIPAGTFTLNGVELPELNQPGPLTAYDLADWINGHTDSVSASVQNGLLTIQGQSAEEDIRLGLGSADAASPEMLRQLGFRPAVYVSGAAADDLVVSVSNTAAEIDVRTAVEPTLAGPLGANVIKVNGISLGAYNDATPTNIGLANFFNDEFARLNLKVESSIDPETGALTFRGLTDDPISLELGPSGTLEDWFNLGFRATVEGDVPMQLDRSWPAGSFVVNGHTMPALTGLDDWLQPDDTLAPNVYDVVNWFNSQTAQTGVEAQINPHNGHLLLSNADATTDTVTLELGSGVSPDAWMALGLVVDSGDTVVSRTLSVGESTDTVPTLVNVAARYGDSTTDSKQWWRTRELDVEFIGPVDDQPVADAVLYRISDRATGDVLAERAFDRTNPDETITFRGIELKFAGAPIVGDRFSIDGNHDGIGNNEIMLDLIALESDTTLFGSGLTITETYIEHVSEVGSVARQAEIAKQALGVVFEQAQEAKDGVSGVSLDHEAADLVRYQQAYQANAKVMQVASSLFDSILQVR